jgi:hypothetical protein
MSSRGIGSTCKIPRSSILERLASEPDESTSTHDWAVKTASSSPPSSSSTTERTQPSTTNPQTSGTADSTGANVNTIAFKSTPKPQDVDTTSTPSASTEDTTTDAIQRAESGERITDEEREILAEQGKLPRDPNDHSGEPMKMHGGQDSLDAPQKTERSKSVAQEGGGEHGKEKGSGTEWVKTTGVAADGGDFDATKPGAGREATREYTNPSRV